MPEDEESLNKAVEDDWTIGAFIAGESAWETDEEAPYFNPDTGRWVRPHWGIEQNGWLAPPPCSLLSLHKAMTLQAMTLHRVILVYFGGYGPAQGQASSSSSSWQSWSQPSQEPEQGYHRNWKFGWWDRSTGYRTKIEHKWEPDQGWESLQSWAGWSQPATPSEPGQGSWSQPSTPTEPGQGKSRSPSRSRDETPLRPSRWDLKVRESQTRRAARRTLMREGQPVPEHLLPQVLDMKAIKKEMAYLVSLAREAAAAAAAAEPEQGKGKGPGQGQKRPKSKEPGKGKEKGKSKAKSRERKPRSPSKPPPSKRTPAQVQKEQLGEKVPGEGKAASPGTQSSYSNTLETVFPQEVKDNPEPVQGLNAIPEPAEPEQGCEAKPEPEAQPQEPEQGCEAKEEPLLETQAQPQPVEAEQANPIEPEQGCADHDGGEEEEEEEPVEEEQEEEREAEKKRKSNPRRCLNSRA